RLAVDQFTLEVPRDAPRKIVIRLDAPRGYRFAPHEGITWGLGPLFKPGSDLACDPPFHATRIVCDNRKPDDGRLRSYKYTVKVLDDKGVPLRTLDPFINNR